MSRPSSTRKLLTGPLVALVHRRSSERFAVIFPRPFEKDTTTFKMHVGGSLETLLSELGFELTSFQIVKHFDLVEQQD